MYKIMNTNKKRFLISSFIFLFTVGTVFLPANLSLATTCPTCPQYPLFYLSKNVNRTNIQQSQTDDTEVLTYTLNYRNVGNAEATNVSIIDDYDESRMDVYDSSGGTVSDGKITWNIGNLEPSASGIITYKLKIKNNLPTGTTYIYNRATINSNETSAQSNQVQIVYINNYSAEVSVDIKANNSDGPITLPYNTSANLSWTSRNANSCFASSGWSGSKTVSGSESTGNLTSSKIFSITCTGADGSSATDHVTVNVGNYSANPLKIEKIARNVSDGLGWANIITADASEIIGFQLRVTNNSNSSLDNVIVKDILPQKLFFKGKLLIDGTPLTTGSGNLFSSGINLGTLSSGQTKIITFEAQLADITQFPFGQTRIINTATVNVDGFFDSDSAAICFVKRNQISSAVTYVSTGLTDNFLDLGKSFLLPLLLTFLIIWLFKSKIIKWEEWLDLVKERHNDYLSKKMLNARIKEIRKKEFLEN